MLSSELIVNLFMTHYTRDLRYRTCVVEHSFICPFCGEEISMVLDLSVRRHTYVEDDSLAHFEAKNFE